MSSIAETTQPTAAPLHQESPGLWTLAWRRLKRDKVGMIAMVIVIAFLLVMLASRVGIVAGNWSKEAGVSYANPVFMKGAENLEAATVAGGVPVSKVPPVDLSDIDPLAPRYKEWEERAKQISVTETPRSDTLLFGGDKWGRDVIQKVIKGSEVSITVGLIAALLATVIGTFLGALAGYMGGKVNDTLEWFYNIFTSIPYILLVLCFAAVASTPRVAELTFGFNKGIVPIIVILGLTGWTGIYRLVRAEYIKHANREYVRAAAAIGTSHTSRMFVHILPNVSHVCLVQLSQHVVQFIKAEVILSFLGLGVPVDMVSWGTMLAEAQSELVIGKWWQLVAAGASMAILVTAFSMLTDSLRDALDPKIK
ncbi:MAG: ABC transporter permease [Betaproteobacteria bacterium]|nr:ABC transporter permease [Betaproteobacteria bacterium]